MYYIDFEARNKKIKEILENSMKNKENEFLKLKLMDSNECFELLFALQLHISHLKKNKNDSKEIQTVINIRERLLQALIGEKN